MKKEVMDSFNEFTKNHGTRELSIDEMGKVNGGADGGWINGVYMSEQEIYDLGIAMASSFGYDIAAAAFCEMTGLSKNEIKDCHHGGSSDLTNMGTLVNRYMKILDNIEDHGHSF